MNTAILFLLTAGTLAAQVSAPSLGLVYDAPNRAVRRISGMPGAATLSDPVLTGIASAVFAPDYSFAIVNDGDFKLYTAAGLRPLPTGLPNAARIALSPAGETAAFYADGVFTLITGLPAQPVLQVVPAPGPVRRFAVSASGTLLISIVQDEGESIFEMAPQAPPAHLLDVTESGAIVFSKDGTKAWVADAAENRIWFVSGLDGTPSAMQIAAVTDGVDTPLSLALSPDARQLFIVNGGTASVLVFDLTHNTAVSTTSCACNPAALRPLAAPLVFALTDVAAGGPMWIFDAAQATPQTLFIPAVNP